MTPTTFLPRVETALSAGHVVFDQADLIAFIESAWPLIREDLDAEKWGRAFVEAQADMVVVGRGGGGE